MSVSEVKITVEAHDVAGFEVARAAVRALGGSVLQQYFIDHWFRLRGPLGDLDLRRATATYIVSFDTSEVDECTALDSINGLRAEAESATGYASMARPLRVTSSR